jgi:hypothetical protein
MDKKEFVEQILPILNQFLIIVGTFVLAWIGSSLRKWAAATKQQTAVVTEEAERDKLNSALRTGAKAALSTSPGASLKEMVAGALDYAKKVAPEAMASSEAEGSLPQKAHARALEARQEAGLQ